MKLVVIKGDRLRYVYRVVVEGIVEFLFMVSNENFVENCAEDRECYGKEREIKARKTGPDAF